MSKRKLNAMNDTKLLHLLAKGLEQKEASEILGISTRSIQNKLSTMRKDYHCKNNIHLFVKLTKVGMI